MSISPNEYISLRRRIIARDFARMNERQRAAVFHIDGPLLILAGAGSGKTTVVINRIANLVKYGNGYASERIPDSVTEEDMALLRACADGAVPTDARVRSLCADDPCPAWRILAITFTNKAAGELRERLSAMLGDEGEDVCAGTFHSFCARLLRREGERLGYSSHFTIYDTDDSRRLMKECLKTLNLAENALAPKAVLGEISRAKDRLLTPDMYAAESGNDPRRKQIARCYDLYQRRLREANAMDFDDLLFQTVHLFETCPDVLTRYQNRFRYIMVDEYQDTNYAQYRFVSLLAAGHGNLCVVGDDDQSIYKFRGATVENILDFEKQFAGCNVIRLEQNYRSTQTILDAANEVIAHNRNRKGKTLWTENPAGDRIQVHTMNNEDEEARFIADTILQGVADGRNYRDYALLYRARAQSNALERAFIKSGVPYRIIGGHRFFDTQEIKDAMAYLRVLNNPADTVSLLRIINLPRRGIGDTTLQAASDIADGLGVPLYEVLRRVEDYPTLSRAAAKVRAFVTMMEPLFAMAEDEETAPHELYTAMLETTGYLAMWQLAGAAEEGRVENLSELTSSLMDYERNSEEDFPSLAGFLEEAALMMDVDNYDAATDAVVMMTMHAAKGLEFPVVFLPGFEDGVFPGMQSMFDESELEEERRLCYVAITRAREKLYITNAACRMLFGKTEHHRPSQFLRAVPSQLMDQHAPKKNETINSGFGGSRYGGGYREAGQGYGYSYTATSSRSSHAPSSYTASSAPLSSHSVSHASKPAAASAPVFQVGDRVKHAAFGVGPVTEAKSMGNDTLLTVAFDRAGTKKLMAKFAKLERVD